MKTLKKISSLGLIVILVFAATVFLSGMAGATVGRAAEEHLHVGLQFPRYRIDEAQAAFQNGFDPLFPACITKEVDPYRYTLTIFYKPTNRQGASKENYALSVDCPGIYSNPAEYGLSQADLEGLDIAPILESGFNGRYVFPNIEFEDTLGKTMSVFYMAYSDLTVADAEFKETFGKCINVLASDFYDPYIVDTFAVETQFVPVKAKLWWTANLYEEIPDIPGEPFETTVCYAVTGIFRKDGVNYAITYLVYAARETVRQDKWGLRLRDDALITILLGIAKKSMQYMVNQFFSA